MQLIAMLYVMFGGAVGSGLRYLSTGYISNVTGTHFPYGTLAVNILGSFLMGVWIALAVTMPNERSRDLHLLFAVGLLGGFTTFSAFSLDVFNLIERGDYLQAGGYVVGSVVLSVVALVVGMFFVKLFL